MLTAETFLDRWGGFCVNGMPTPDDAARLIGAATAFLSRQTSVYFGEPKDVDGLQGGNGSNLFFLLGEPLDGMVVSEALAMGAELVELVPEEFAVRGRCLYRLLSRYWWLGREYRLEYRIGYELDTGPEEVVEAVAQMAVWLWLEQTIQTVDGGIREERLGDYQYKLGGSGADRMLADLPLVHSVIMDRRRHAV